MYGVGIEWGRRAKPRLPPERRDNHMNRIRAFALVFVAMMAFALAALACEDAAPPPASEPIAAATAVPTSAPAPTVAPPPTAVPTNTPAPTATPAPTPTAAEAKRIYEDAVAAVSDLASYRLQLDEALDLGEGNKTKFLMDIRYQPPDVGKSKVVIALGAQTPIENEDILIDGSSYEKSSGNPFHDDPNAGKWIRTDARAGSWDELAADLLSNIEVDGAAGNENLDGAETVRLKGIAWSDQISFSLSSLGGGVSEPMEVSVWVGVNDGLIRRIAASTAAGAPESVEITAVFSDFNVPVVVEAPKDYIEWGERESPNAPSGTDVETTALSSGWTQVDLAEYRFSVSLPPGWSAFGSDVDSQYEMWDYIGALPGEAAYTANQLILATIHYFVPHRMVGYEAASEGGEAHVSALIVNIMGVLDDAELSAYVDDRMEQTENNLTINGAIDRRAETLPAGDAERVEFAYQLPNEMFGMENDDDTEYAQIQYFILSEGDAYILTFATTADRMDAMRATFDEMARTARAAGKP